MTPEGLVKKDVKKVLASHGKGVWYHMAVTNGMGAPTLDFTGCAYGLFFAIETKAPGKEPTPRQMLTIGDMRLSLGRVFVIDGDTTEFSSWLTAIKTMRERLASKGAEIEL